MHPSATLSGQLKGKPKPLQAFLPLCAYYNISRCCGVEIHELSLSYQRLQNSHGTVVLGTAPAVYPASLEDFCSLD